ncbi:MAG: beta-galactosidase [Clostridia bacterium]|nr:beta-galactosidase [Clostridia bacterium]
MSVFEVRNDGFYYDDNKMPVLSGAMHYFRTLPEYWEDRLRKLKACGLNTVETYIAWNIHEKREGEFDFTGIADIERFIEIAGSLGLFVILRPSPYICSEWDFGGLPAWLLADKNINVRCSCPLYLEKVTNYYKELIPRLTKYQCTNGGPVIMFQIENEYGSYGNDKKYLRYLKDLMIELGVNVQLFTSDGGTFTHLNGGTLPEVFKVANFGGWPDEDFNCLAEFQPNMPLMCGEFWNGWFDHFGEDHHVRDLANYEKCLDRLFEMGGNINIYMFHGGTSFGWMAGANHGGKYEPDVSSYDYDALLDEAGNITEKYRITQRIIKKYFGDFEAPEFPKTPAKAYNDITFTEQAYLFDCMDSVAKKFHTASALTMERYGQNYGFICYKTTVPYYKETILTIEAPHDRAHTFINGERQAIIYRNDENKTVKVSFPEKENTLEIFVDTLGRVNFGHHLHDRKGLDCPVLIAGFQELFGWDVSCIELDDISVVPFKECSDNVSGPTFLRSKFNIDETPVDTYLRLDNFARGQIWVNGFNLSRYWVTVGPQKTFYIPACLLKQGENEIIIFETDSSIGLTASFTAAPEL